MGMKLQRYPTPSPGSRQAQGLSEPAASSTDAPQPPCWRKSRILKWGPSNGEFLGRRARLKSRVQMQGRWISWLAFARRHNPASRPVHNSSSDRPCRTLRLPLRGMLRSISLWTEPHSRQAQGWLTGAASCSFGGHYDSD